MKNKLSRKFLYQHRNEYGMIVEVGCGEMENLHLVRMNKKMFGIETSPSRVHTAIEKIKKMSIFLST